MQNFRGAAKSAPEGEVSKIHAWTVVHEHLWIKLHSCNSFNQQETRLLLINRVTHLCNVSTASHTSNRPRNFVQIRAQLFSYSLHRQKHKFVGGENYCAALRDKLCHCPRQVPSSIIFM